MPKLLLTDTGIRPLDKLVYVVAGAAGPASLEELSRLLALPPSTVSGACGRLSRLGWLYKKKEGCCVRPVTATPFAVQEQMVRDFAARLATVKYKGEFMMKAWADLLIFSDNFVDQARPEFLKRPDTGERLELDRYYPGLKLAQEFHGPQHFGPTREYPDVRKYNQLRMRDCLKRALCEDAGVRLVVFSAEDLTYARVCELLSPHVALRQVDPKGPYVTALEQQCVTYASILERALGQDQPPSNANA